MGLREAIQFGLQALPDYLQRKRQAEQDNRAELMADFAMQMQQRQLAGTEADRAADNARLDEGLGIQRSRLKTQLDAQQASRAGLQSDRDEDNRRLAARDAMTAKNQAGNLKVRQQQANRPTGTSTPVNPINTVPAGLRIQKDEHLEPYITRLRDQGVSRDEVKRILQSQGIE
jgi:hypothetical protein